MVICLACACVGGAVEPGMARVNVLAELGQPVSALARGNTEVLTYKGGVRIKLTNGKVTEIIGLKPAEAPAAGSTAAATEAKPEAEPEMPEEPPLTKEQIAEQEKEERLHAAADAKARVEMEKALIDLENTHGQPPKKYEPPKFNPVEFLIGLVVKWLLMLAALKLTCKYWGCEVSGSGLLIVAAVDVGVRSVISLLGFFLLGLSSMFYADEAIAAVAMVFVLRKVSTNQSMAQAMQITMTCKVFSVVVGSFLFTMLLRALH